MIQKGCVAAEIEDGAYIDLHNFNGSGCTKQFMDASQVRNVPMMLDKISDLEATMCVCNYENFCNRGPTRRIEYMLMHSGSAITDINLINYAFVLLLFLLQNFN